MNKLDSTSGHLFSGLAETLNARGMTKSVKGSAASAKQDSSFHDLLNNVSNNAKRASSDQADQSPVKPPSAQSRAVQLTGHDERKDASVRARSSTADEPETSRKSDSPDQATTNIENRQILPSVLGQELAAVPGLQTQVQLLGGGPGAAAPGRTERPTRDHNEKASELPSTGAMASTEIGSSLRSTAPQAAAPSAGGQAAAKTTSAGGDFEAVAANIEQVTKLAARPTLPEVTKVNVLQQETHLPPVGPFTAPQQVANAIVADLKDSPAPAASAAPDPTSSQSNAPDQPVKILTISLEPPDLGNVTVRLRLSGDAVSVHLAADRRDTSQMLEEQRGSIREIMHSAGYVADVAPVQHGVMDGLQTGSGQSQQSFSGQNQSSNAQGALDNFNTPSGQSESGARQDRQDRNPGQETRHEQDVVSSNRRSAVYL
jgi:chemotaxis protein MotD